MEHVIYITNEQDKVEFSEKYIKLAEAAVNAVLNNENYDTICEVSITFTDDDEIREINNQYRKIDKPTDVLSFPLSAPGEQDINPENGAVLLGDIIISLERAVSQAEEYGHGVEREVAFLTAHSMLHLLGYDHENGGAEEELMREKQRRVMRMMGL